MTYRHNAARVARYVEAENAGTPLLCSVCLGPSTHARLVRTPSGKRCHNCNTPYASFRWRVAADARPRETLICRSCADARNVCQGCLSDLATELSLESRAALSAEELASFVERKRQMSLEQDAAQLLQNKAILRARFQPRPCSFFAQGKCTRGDACPFHHDNRQGDNNVPEKVAPANVDAVAAEARDVHSLIARRVTETPVVHHEATPRDEAEAQEGLAESAVVLPPVEEKHPEHSSPADTVARNSNGAAPRTRAFDFGFLDTTSGGTTTTSSRPS